MDQDEPEGEMLSYYKVEMEKTFYRKDTNTDVCICTFSGSFLLIENISGCIHVSHTCAPKCRYLFFSEAQRMAGRALYIYWDGSSIHRLTTEKFPLKKSNSNFRFQQYLKF